MKNRQLDVFGGPPDANGVLVQGWLYQSQLNPVAELDSSGNIVSRFVYRSRANVPDYMIRRDTVYRLVADHLGSVRLVVDTATGTVAQRIDYDEWGRVIANTNPGFQPFGFAGGLADEGDSLVRLGARDFDPSSGRWTTKDPIGFQSGNVNVYRYISDDPVNLVDPTGLCPEQAQGQQCSSALQTAGQSQTAINLALSDWATISFAAALNGIDPALLAAIGVRESGFLDVWQHAGGRGAGVFQIDLGKHPDVTAVQAFDIMFAANFAAGMLASNASELGASFPNFTAAQLLQATAASYNFGTSNISGNPATIDVGTTQGNYGSNVVGLMQCFQPY